MIPLSLELSANLKIVLQYGTGKHGTKKKALQAGTCCFLSGRLISQQFGILKHFQCHAHHLHLCTARLQTFRG